MTSGQMNWIWKKNHACIFLYGPKNVTNAQCVKWTGNIGIVLGAIKDSKL
jgi:hypothetical protein